MGGDVKGGKILGKYPDDLLDTLNIGRSRIIPTTSWDSVSKQNKRLKLFSTNHILMLRYYYYN